MNYQKNPVKAIRKKCLECMGNSRREVLDCPSTECPIYPFRLGKNPYRTRVMTDEQKQAAAERMRKLHEAKKGSTNG